MFLLLLAALNMPQAMVLCIGHDGHVAIEPAAHDHCADGSRPHDHGPAGLETGDHAHVGHEHCPPCIDIPIPAGASDERTAAQKSKSGPVCFAASQPAMRVSDAFNGFDTVASIPSWLLPSCDISLHCTILQV